MGIVEFMSLVMAKWPLAIGVVVLSTIWVLYIGDSVRVILGNYLFSGRKEFERSPFVGSLLIPLMAPSWFGDRYISEDFYEKGSPFVLLLLILISMGAGVAVNVLVKLQVPFAVLLIILTIYIILRLAKYTIAKGYVLADHINDPKAHKKED